MPCRSSPERQTNNRVPGSLTKQTPFSVWQVARLLVPLALISLVILLTDSRFLPWGLAADYLMNISHLFGFFLLGFFLTRWFAGRTGTGRRKLLIWVGLFALGALAELIQPLFHRYASLLDALFNGVGALAGIAMASLARTYRDRLGWLLTALALLVLLPGIWLAFQDARLYQAFPRLYDFDLPTTRYYWKPARVVTRHDEPVLVMDFASRRDYQFRPLRRDWRDYQTLVLALENPSVKTQTVTVRVDDTQHLRGTQPTADRFQKLYRIAAGETRLRIPLAEIRDAPKQRQMDLDEIKRLVIYQWSPTPGSRMYLKDIRLE